MRDLEGGRKKTRGPGGSGCFSGWMGVNNIIMSTKRQMSSDPGRRRAHVTDSYLQTRFNGPLRRFKHGAVCLHRRGLKSLRASLKSEIRRRLFLGIEKARPDRPGIKKTGPRGAGPGVMRL